MVALGSSWLAFNKAERLEHSHRTWVFPLEGEAMTEKSYSEQPTYPAEKARQGEIILRTRMQRIVFFGGLVAMVVLALAAQFIYLH